MMTLRDGRKIWEFFLYEMDEKMMRPRAGSGFEVRLASGGRKKKLRSGDKPEAGEPRN
jgi:hypothetical protein